MSFMAMLRRRARFLKVEVYALYLACRDPRTPWAARLIAGAVVAYALSPIDLIPDAIPVLGMLDDLVLVPAGISLALRLIPANVMADCRERAEMSTARLRRNLLAGATVVGLWLLILAVGAYWLFGLLTRRG